MGGGDGKAEAFGLDGGEGVGASALEIVFDGGERLPVVAVEVGQLVVADAFAGDRSGESPGIDVGGRK